MYGSTHASLLFSARRGNRTVHHVRFARYFFHLATTRTFRVAEIAPGVSASLIISACSCWCRFPLPVAGLALSLRPTYRTSRRVSSSRGCMDSRSTCHVPRNMGPWHVLQRLYGLAQHVPRTHIPRLLLRPHHLRRRTVPGQQVASLVGGEWVELLHAKQRHVVRLALLARG